MPLFTIARGTGPLSWPERGLARFLTVALLGTSVVLTPAAPASAAGTVVFDQPFHDNTADGLGAVVLPALPAGTTATNFACLTAVRQPQHRCPHSCTDEPGRSGIRDAALDEC